MNKINEASLDLGLNINFNKGMACSRDHYKNAQLTLNNTPIERVHRFEYLRSIITDNMVPDKQKKCKTKTTYGQLLHLVGAATRSGVLDPKNEDDEETRGL